METSNSEIVSTRLERIAKLAKEAPAMQMRTLAHHIDIVMMREAYRITRKDGATGIDGVTASQYAENLEPNLLSVVDRAKSGLYRAPPVRRVHIPKGNGKETRPLGIPTFEDKVLQRAVVMVVQSVYEQDFLDCSYGFRPGRSQHQMLQKLWDVTTRMRGGWVLEIDIRKYFDSLPHAALQEVLRRRVIDGVLVRLVGKWLNAGVMEGNQLSRPTSGTPQGGVISPLLANIYLHVVLDEWFEHEVKPRLNGTAHLFRYADDAAMVFAYEEDARRVLRVLSKRFGKYGLELHPDKTRLIAFHHPKRMDGDNEPGTFDLLGFTHYWGLSKAGKWIVRRRTSKSSFRRALKKVAVWCKANRHLPMSVQYEILCKKVNGHYGYFGITNNDRMLKNFRQQVDRVWCKWLSRRSQRDKIGRVFEWLRRFRLPPAKIVHSVYA